MRWEALWGAFGLVGLSDSPVLISGVLESVWTPIFVALLAGSGIPMWLIGKLDKRNTKQHGENLSVLQDIQSSVQEVAEDTREVKSHLLDHLRWHMDRENNDGTKR